MTKRFGDAMPSPESENNESQNEKPFTFKKGNIPFSAFRAEHPIDQKKVDPAIWSKMKEEAEANAKVVIEGDNNEVKFLIMRDDKTGDYPAKYIQITMADREKVMFEPSKSLCDLIADLPQEYFNSLN